jgi:hypothetical protein
MKKLCKGYSYCYNGSIPDYWREAAQLICDNMDLLKFEPVAEDYPPGFQKEIDRVCTGLGIDQTYWPETLSIYPIF